MQKEIQYKVIKPIFNTEIRYIDDTMGYGVFANEFIPKNSIVEVCYSIPVMDSKQTHPLYDYVFYNHINNTYFITFGYGSIYNHSFDGNIAWQIAEYDKNIIEFFSIKDINVDDELCHNYGEKYWKLREKKLL